MSTTTVAPPMPLATSMTRLDRGIDHSADPVQRVALPGGRSERRAVVVGASLAGLRAAEALRAGGFAGHLSVVGEELHEPYDRPPLSKGVLAGTTNLAALRLPSLTDPATLDASWRLGVRAVGLDLRRREVVLDDGTRLAFDGLVIATGARPRLLPGAEDITGVHALRTLDDALRLREALLQRPCHVAVLGSGFIGSEVAAIAGSLGLDITLVDAAPLPMLAAVGEQVAAFCADLHRRHGVHLRLGTGVRQLHATSGGRLSSVELTDGTRVVADLAVMGLGALPNTEWLTGSGVLLDRGVRTDAALRVLDPTGAVVPGVVAAGDVARWPHQLFDDELVRIEHWSNAVDQAAAAARSLLHHLAGAAHPQGLSRPNPDHLPQGDDPAGAPPPFTAVPSFWSDQYDAKILSVGLPAFGTDSAVLDGDLAGGRFTVGYGRHGRMFGAVAVNYPRRLAGYRRHIAARGPWPPPMTASTTPTASPTDPPTSGASTAAPPASTRLPTHLTNPTTADRPTTTRHFEESQ